MIEECEMEIRMLHARIRLFTNDFEYGLEWSHLNHVDWLDSFAQVIALAINQCAPSVQ